MWCRLLKYLRWCAMTAGYWSDEVWMYTCSLCSGLQTENIQCVELKLSMVEYPLKATWQGASEGLERTPWVGPLVNSCSPSSVSAGAALINHAIEAGSRRHPSHLGHGQGREAQTRQMYLFWTGNHAGSIRTREVRPVARLYLYRCILISIKPKQD